MQTVLVTNVNHYAGPGVVETLVQQGVRVICHDASFSDAAACNAFRSTRPDVECLMAQEPVTLMAELNVRAIEIDAIVSNDVYPITPRPIGEIEPANLRNTFEAVFMFPVLLAQLLLPAMKARGSGRWADSARLKKSVNWLLFWRRGVPAL